MSSNRFRLIALPFLVFVLFSISFSSAFEDQSGAPTESDLIAGRNVNMVNDETVLQRQNEPSIAASNIDPRFLLAGANDYSTVALATASEHITNDAWLGYYTSTDGGESWTSGLLPGFDATDPSPLAGYDAAADPTVRAGIDGWFFYSGIVFDRIENGDSAIFVARFKHEGENINPYGIQIVDTGTSGQFSDKPWLAVDVPRGQYKNGIIYIVYSVFLGQLDQNIHSKILISRSTNNGVSWSKPIKVSEGEQKNQGTNLYIDPRNGDVYVAWRRFASTNATDAILIARSQDHGQSFTKAEEVATILRPFDQSTIGVIGGPSQFRMQSLPTMAIDHTGRIYLAWSQRGDDPEFWDDARIVMTSLDSQSWGSSWPTAEIVERPFVYVDPEKPGIQRLGYPIFDESGGITNLVPISGHQFMPSMTFAARKLVLAWFDSRFSMRYFDEYGQFRDGSGGFYGESTIEDPSDRIMDIPTSWVNPDTGMEDIAAYDIRETIDVRTAQADPGFSPDFDLSIQTSRYLWYLDDEGGDYKLRQAQFNPPNYQLFNGGISPFHGDYLDIAAGPSLIKEGDSWRANTGFDPVTGAPTSVPFLFYVSWTDNRDVLPPADNLWIYQSSTSGSGNCALGMRNQNVYVSKITRGIEVSSLGDFEQEGRDRDVFVIQVRNKTGSQLYPDENSVMINIKLPESSGASFFPDDVPTDLPGGIYSQTTATNIYVSVPAQSNIYRMVFVPHQSSTYPIDVEFYDITGGSSGILIETVSLNPTSSLQVSGLGTSFIATDIINWDNPNFNPQVNKDVINPNILSPNILSPNILSPNILSPNILSPNILSPNILSPNILSPNILSPNILSPNILSPNILSTSLKDADVLDKTWTVQNETGAVASYTFKSIAGNDLPSGDVYAQLLIFKLHFLPAMPSNQEGCTMLEQVQHELLVNITNPYIIDEISPGEVKSLLGDPLLEFENATFTLNPDEEALILLRVVDMRPKSAVGSGRLARVANGEPTLPEATVEEFLQGTGAVVVHHASTAANAVNAATLQILPMVLPVGKVGQPYPPTEIIAIGGTNSYSWMVTDVSDLNAGNGSVGGQNNEIIEGLFYEQVPHDEFGQVLKISDVTIPSVPERYGSFLVTVQVSDSSTTATRQFILQIEEPDPVVLTVSQDPAPSGIKDAPYAPASPDLPVIVSATGGLPAYTWDLTAVRAGSADPVDLGLGLTQQESDPTSAVLTGTPRLAGNFLLTATAEDSTQPQSAPCTPVSFSICIIPGGGIQLVATQGQNDTICPADTPTQSSQVCELPPGTLGEDYGSNDIHLAVLNHEVEAGAALTWEIVEGELPPGLELDLDSSIVNPVITGTPEFGGDLSFPKPPYEFTVKVTEMLAGADCGWTRETQRAFSMVINPKSPEWYVESEMQGIAKVIAVGNGPTGNLYVAGHTTGGNIDYYLAIFGVDENGERVQLWSDTYDGPGGGDDIPSAIAVDDTGFYVTGTSLGSNTGTDIYTVKYSLDGTFLWETRFDGPSHLGDGANAIAVDATHVYAAGYVHRGNQTKHADYVTIKYDKQSGEEVWDETYDSRRNGNDIITAMAVDSGFIFVTGMSQESLNQESTTHDFFTVKYDGEGNIVWEAREPGPAGHDYPTAMIVKDNAVYVTGFATNDSSNFEELDLEQVAADYFTVKYTDNGDSYVPAWNGGRIYGHPNKDDRAVALAVDAAGNVFVTGRSQGQFDIDFATVAYSASGSLLWDTVPGSDQGALRFAGPQGDDIPVGIALDDLGNIVVAGHIGTSKGSDYFALAYTSTGEISWIGQLVYPGNEMSGNEVATAMFSDDTAIYLTGYSVESGKFLTVKFSK